MTELKLISNNPLVKKIASGEAKTEMLDLLLAKQLPLTDEEYLEGLVFLLTNEDLKSRAMELLKKIPESTKSTYIEKSEANPRVAYFLVLEALNWKNSKILSRAIRNQMLPYEFLVKIAEKGDISVLEMLLDNQIKLIAFPEIMDAMEKNPGINNFVRGKIKEIREFYLKADKAEEIPEAEVMENVKEMIALEQAEKKKEQENGLENTEANKKESAAELDNLNEVAKAKTTLQQINQMSISDRIKLALVGTKTHRLILVKDSNKMVSLAVLESPKVTTDEVVILAKDKSIAGDLIAKIANHREWTKNYSVFSELVQHPKTPIKSALSFANRLHLRDLKLLSQNKNTNPVIREFAANLFSKRVRTVKEK